MKVESPCGSNTHAGLKSDQFGPHGLGPWWHGPVVLGYTGIGSRGNLGRLRFGLATGLGSARYPQHAVLRGCEPTFLAVIGSHG